MTEIVEGDSFRKVDRILDRRRYRNTQRFEYRVQYEGYDSGHNEWIAEYRLVDGCEQLLKAYNSANPKP